jgi:hypothetical protein
VNESSPPGQRFHEIGELLEAYADTGFAFTDTPEAPGPGLASYLRIVARRPGRGAVAVQQLDDLLSVGLFSEEIAEDIDGMPEIQPPTGMSVEDCLRISRNHIHRALQNPSLVPRMNPQNRWEWNERSPALSQFFGAYLNQRCLDFHASPEEAVDDYRDESDPDDVRQSVGEITELLTVIASDQELERATDALGIEVLPPQDMTLRQWLEAVRTRLGSGSGR